MSGVTVASQPVRRLPVPRWLDARLLSGVALVLVSVIAGARVVSGAQHRQHYLAFVHDLAAGSVVTRSDLSTVTVRLSAATQGSYLGDAAAAVGHLLNRAVARGELVARSALDVPPPSTTLVVPLGPDAAPRLAAGERIAVWLSTASCPSVLLIPDVTVQSARPASNGVFDSSGGQSVVVQVPPAAATRVVSALAMDGARLRAGVLLGPTGSDAALPDIESCRARSS
jgi:hypothetical protein